MNVPVLLHGTLASHRRGQVLKEALSAAPAKSLPDGRAIVLAFADGFQAAEPEEQSRLIEWTRTPGHLLLLVPPFGRAQCERPVAWRAERIDRVPQGGEGLAKVLGPEVAYRLTGNLQTPSVPGATWSDLSVCMGAYRLHPAAGLFVVTCLPIWSLAVLDAAPQVEGWLTRLADLAGDLRVAQTSELAALRPDHYGFLVFLLSHAFENEEQAIAGLSSSMIFRFSGENGRSLLRELNERGLVVGAAPTTQAYELVMQSPYAPYVSAVREVSKL
ncbi:hypothetical protein AB7Z32_40110 [Bradyrhizobium sp. 482_C4_N1_1]|uniref:hypothetical protein n=1 Tax=unclassified Bradyrhizobium TaxID=2631580 RepID=UPI003F88D1CF